MITISRMYNGLHTGVGNLTVDCKSTTVDVEIKRQGPTWTLTIIQGITEIHTSDHSTIKEAQARLDTYSKFGLCTLY